MADTILDALPSTFAGGETVQWRRSYGDFGPADGWTQKVYLAGAGTLVVTGVDTDGRWLFTITAQQAAGLPPGRYRWTAYAEKGAGAALERHRLDEGALEVTIDLTAAIAGDTVSHEERAIPILEAAIEKRVAADLKAYSFTSRSVTKEELRDMVRLLAQYRTRVTMRKHGGLLPPVQVSFVRPS